MEANCSSNSTNPNRRLLREATACLPDYVQVDDSTYNEPLPSHYVLERVARIQRGVTPLTQPQVASRPCTSAVTNLLRTATNRLALN